MLKTIDSRTGSRPCVERREIDRLRVSRSFQNNQIATSKHRGVDASYRISDRFVAPVLDVRDASPPVTGPPPYFNPSSQSTKSMRRVNRDSTDGSTPT